MVTKKTNKEPIKVTFNLPADELESLKKMAGEIGHTVTNTLRAAINTEIFLYEEEKKGGKILIENEDGNMERVIRR